MSVDINDQVKTAAMSAFEAFKSDLAPKLEKLDALDLAKFDKVEKAMGDAIEISQKAEAKSRAAEEKQKEFEASHKALEAELSGLKTAFNRAPAPTTEDKGKELALLRTKAFNEFARKGSKDESLDQFIARRSAETPEYKALSVGTDSAGGYLVVPEFGDLIQAKVFESSPIRTLASVTTIGSDSIEFPLDYDEAASGWVNEVGTRSETNTPVVGKVAIVPEEVYANPKVTTKMLEDASIDIEAWLVGKIAAKFGRDEATAFVTGSGVGKPRGLASYTAGTDLTAGQIEQVVSGSASALTLDGFVNTQNALKEVYQSNASWLMRRATWGATLLIKDGEGRPVFNMDYNRSAGMPAAILGNPLYFAADVAAVAANALSVIYGDIRTAYQIVDRRGFTVLRDPFTTKGFVQFYATKRVGGAVVNHEAVKLMKVST